MNSINSGDQPAARPETGAGDLPSVVLVARDGARAEVYLHGAHLTSWRPAADGAERLFLSALSEYREGTAIRGGVPVIFPQFAALGPLPKHGFVRHRAWALVHSAHANDGAAQVRLRLNDSDETRAIWPHRFICDLDISVFGESLDIRLTIENVGVDAFEFTAALHTYLRVEAIAAARVEGLQNLHYRDSLRHGETFIEAARRLAIDGEVDRIYFDAPARLEVHQPAGTMIVCSEGFSDAVIWNPGPGAGARLADLEAGGYARMLCVEAAQIGRPVSLAPGRSWSGSQTLIAE